MLDRRASDKPATSRKKAKGPPGAVGHSHVIDSKHDVGYLATARSFANSTRLLAFTAPLNANRCQSDQRICFVNLSNRLWWFSE